MLCGVALAAAIAPFFALAAFAHPQNDDWVYAASTLQRGWAGANEFWYRAWSGRYTATAILTGTPFLGGVDEGATWGCVTRSAPPPTCSPPPGRYTPFSCC